MFVVLLSEFSYYFHPEKTVLLPFLADLKLYKIILKEKHCALVFIKVASKMICELQSSVSDSFNRRVWKKANIIAIHTCLPLNKEFKLLL